MYEICTVKPADSTLPSQATIVAIHEAGFDAVAERFASDDVQRLARLTQLFHMLKPGEYDQLLNTGIKSRGLLAEYDGLNIPQSDDFLNVVKRAAGEFTKNELFIEIVERSSVPEHIVCAHTMLDNGYQTFTIARWNDQATITPLEELLGGKPAPAIITPPEAPLTVSPTPEDTVATEVTVVASSTKRPLGRKVAGVMTNPWIYAVLTWVVSGFVLSAMFRGLSARFDGDWVGLASVTVAYAVFWVVATRYPAVRAYAHGGTKPASISSGVIREAEPAETPSKQPAKEDELRFIPRRADSKKPCVWVRYDPEGNFMCWGGDYRQSYRDSFCDDLNWYHIRRLEWIPARVDIPNARWATGRKGGPISVRIPAAAQKR